MPVRTFLALDIDEATRRRLAEAASGVAVGQAKVKLVAPENLHVTLNFLGDVDDGQLSELCRVVADVAAEVEPFDFTVRAVRCIPPAGRLRMIWAGVDDPTGRLVLLQKRLSTALASLGFAQERRDYHPHVTLARVRYAGDAQAIREAAGRFAEEEFTRQSAQEVVVYTSRLTPAGPIYSPAAHPPLGRAGGRATLPEPPAQGRGV